jgi:hypothetical protein
MLLNALRVLRLPEWLASQPAAVYAHFVPALFARIARRLHMPGVDPHAPLLRLDEPAQRALHAATCRWAGFRWTRGFDAAGLAPAAATSPVDEALWRWQRALVRLLRRHAGIGLAHVVRRRAGVSITATHVDVVFPLADADAALRRVGLDSDPGWVAWFGWIVAFHYLHGAPDGAR